MINRNTIYLDYQASTPIDPRVLTEMAPYYRESFGNPHSADHILGWQANQAVERASAQIASLLGAEGDEIVITSGATEANNQAIIGTSVKARGTSRNRIIVSAVEHKCVLAAAQAANDLFNMTVEHAPVDRYGRINVDWLKRNLDSDVLLVSAISVNNEIGTIQDMEAIASAARNVGALIHSDCAQAPLATDVSEIASHVDLLSLSGHKIYGPKGVGALLVKRSIRNQISPIIYGGGQQNNLRSGTVPTHLAVGIGQAVALASDDTATKRRNRCRMLRDQFVSYLSESDIDIEIITPTEHASHPANANIRFVGVNAEDILHSIQPRIAASTGSACTSGTPEPSHVLRAIGLDNQGSDECVRFSVGYETAETDIEEAANLISEAVKSLAMISTKNVVT